MIFQEYRVLAVEEEVPGTFLVRVKPGDNKAIFEFLPGQYCQIKNPQYGKPQDIHTFSIASSPLTNDHLEFCIKVYGNWTKTLSEIKTGDTLQIAGPMGIYME